MSAKYNLEECDLKTLRGMAENMDIKINQDKKTLIKEISDSFRKYEKYKKEKLDKYTKKGQLGNKGREAIVYLAVDKKGKEYAMKTFKKTKSLKKIEEQFKFQKLAYKKGISPKVYDYDLFSRYIIMEKMDSHLFEILEHKNLTKKQQERIIEIFRIMDKIGIFHNDANIANYMIKDKEIYIIDFGLSKEINKQLCKKYETNTPNYKLMTIGIIIEMKKYEVDEKSYKYLLQHVSEEDKIKYGFVES